jgi:hypothetical protein
MQELLIYTEKISPRTEYIFDFVLLEFSGLGFKFTTDLEEFKQSGFPKINFSNQTISDGIHLAPDGFLFDNGISEKVKFEELNEVGKIFFALSRYEEYLPNEKDQHDRISGKNKVYKTPFVDEWILKFQLELKQKYPQLNFKKREFELVLTCDVDQAWKYKHKGFKRTYGGFLIDFVKFDFPGISTRIQTILGLKKDPFDTFDIFKELTLRPFDKLRVTQHIESHGGHVEPQMIFFWLMADYGKFDKNNPVENLAFQNKIREISKWAECGIHPSYASNSNPEKIKMEIERLEKILGKKITKSRQHYIKLHFPKTYQMLIQNGIREDHSMGYADETGFRAGTCTPFFWYDLSKDEVRDLKIFPFCAMDVSMRNYMKLTIEESVQEIQRLKSEIQKVNGKMIVLFHNSNLNEEWKGWGKVMESLFVQP